MKKMNLTIQGKAYEVDILKIEGNIAQVSVNGVTYSVEMPQPAVAPAAPVAQPVAAPAPVAQPVVEAPAPAPKASTTIPGGNHKIQSPLPGIVLNIAVNVGDKVSLGQKIIVLEAMKMENNINADKDGVVTAIRVNQGDSVLEGDILIEIAAE